MITEEQKKLLIEVEDFTLEGFRGIVTGLSSKESRKLLQKLVKENLIIENSENNYSWNEEARVEVTPEENTATESPKEDTYVGFVPLEDTTEFFSSGSLLLNLALTGDIDKGYPIGKMTQVAGESSTGKTLLAIEGMLRFQKKFKEKGKLFYLDTESAFNPSYAEGIGLETKDITFLQNEPDKNGEQKPFTLEDLVRFFQTEAYKEKEYFMLVVDSLDGLKSTKDFERDVDKGTYGMHKQKLLSDFLPLVCQKLKKDNGFCLLISQLRDNVNPATPYSPKHRISGGKAVLYWIRQMVSLKKTGDLVHKTTNLINGATVKVKIVKNHIGSRGREVEFNFLEGYGIDNVMSIIEFLQEQKEFTGGWYNTPDKKVRLEEFLEYVENNPTFAKSLKEKAQKIWQDREDTTKNTTRNRFILED